MHPAQTLIIQITYRNAHDAGFKLKVTDLAIKEGNRGTARNLAIN